MAHHIKSHHWINGILSTVEHFFEEFEEAMEHVRTSDAHSIKVYNDNGELVHSSISSITPEEISTYA
jgi:hypothetical protein